MAKSIHMMILCLAAAEFAHSLNINLSQVSNFTFPYDYSASDEAMYTIDDGALEASAFDPEFELVYAAGAKYIHILDLSDPANPEIIFKRKLELGTSDVDVCGNLVALALEGATAIDKGKILLFYRYTKGSKTWDTLREIEGQVGPDTITFSKDCSTIIIGNEGEAEENSTGVTFVNPEGSVTIIKISEGNQFDVKHIFFTSFNSRSSELENNGVRWPYKGQLGNGTGGFSQNLEPGSATFSDDLSRAYVCLQENNAIAVIDLESQTVLDIYPLGTKSWKDLQVDASDMDGGIKFKNFDIGSFRQPDTIRFITIGGQGYIITANEGDFFDYSFGNKVWAEFKTGKEIIDGNMLSENASASLRDAMNSSADLGRMYFSVVDGLDASGKVLKPSFYGGRSFSIFNATSFELVYDSGDESAKMIAKFYPEVFNGDSKTTDPATQTPASLVDSRSHTTGSECESLALGEINGTTVLFVGVDGPSTILIYSFKNDIPVPTFESIFRAGGTNETFQKLFEERNLGDLAPEGLIFVPASGSTPARLLVTAKVTGSLSVYNVIDFDAPRNRCASTITWATMFLVLLCSISSSVGFTL